MVHIKKKKQKPLVYLYKQNYEANKTNINTIHLM